MIILQVTLTLIYLTNLTTSDQSVAEQIHNVICKDGKRDDKWYRSVMCCQSINCYKLVSYNRDICKTHTFLFIAIKSCQKKATELNNETRSALYKKLALSEDTRKAVCSNGKSYVEKLKDITTDLRGDMLDDCSDEKGVEAKMGLKVVCIAIVILYQ